MSHPRNPPASALDVVCFSHLRWKFVFQRPQHLLSRCARTHRVYYVEESLFEEGGTPRLHTESVDGVTVVVPVLPNGLEPSRRTAVERELIDTLFAKERIAQRVLWYYTPMALAFTSHLSASAVVYDCMDELSAFKGAPDGLTMMEARLMGRASLVLTGGQTLFEAKRHQHHNIHPFPSSVDIRHFARSRGAVNAPPDQEVIARPRLGFFGVIDERMDLPLLDGMAAARPGWNLVIVGPVVKIDPAELPRRPNIYYLGGKQYSELPEYIAGWDVALLPFARNESTRFISPTKTPEYMAAGKPVVSTSITDVVRPYGERGLVRIADDVDAFVRACEEALSEDPDARLRRFDAYLARMSWDRTWSRIEALMNDAVVAAYDQPIVGSALPPRAAVWATADASRS